MPFTPRLILVSAPSVKVARNLAKLLLQQRLAACINVVPGLESHYWWKGRLEMSAEVLLLIKSSAEQFETSQELVMRHHPYECPEIVAVDPMEIAPAYKAWWEKNLG